MPVCISIILASELLPLAAKPTFASPLDSWHTADAILLRTTPNHPGPLHHRAEYSYVND